LKQFPTFDVLGSQVSRCTHDELLLFADEALSQNKASHHLMAINPIKVIRAQKERELEGHVSNADVVYADGIGVCLAMRLLHGQAQPRIPGYDFHFEVLKLCEKKGAGVYLLGAQSAVVEASVTHYNRRFPELKIVGHHDGYFTESTFDAEIMPAISRTKPGLVVVAMGAKVQEYWIEKIRSAVTVPLLMGVGGSFDAMVGEAPRAPEWMLSLGLEWFYRLAKQPKRYAAMKPLPDFFIQTVARKIKGLMS